MNLEIRSRTNHTFMAAQQSPFDEQTIKKGGWRGRADDKGRGGAPVRKGIIGNDTLVALNPFGASWYGGNRARDSQLLKRWCFPLHTGPSHPARAHPSVPPPLPHPLDGGKIS
ncbi:hypothetical protein CEXT_491341 [Caerostris extrusa]|uniref:Uncharacterized protein n=1 Tax=Caerostris extrusa TaxID=172846 RepID=A0AAV4STR0_CAEEX|nr:hypothetical protein CEXT_491341 [Caerostris extrusa]